MARDYKKARNKSSSARASMTGNIFFFLVGLLAGLLVAALVFFRSQLPAPLSGDRGKVEEPSPGRASSGEDKPPQLTFEFYNELINRKLNVSEWVAEEKPAEKDGPEEQEKGPEQQVAAGSNVYGHVLQVGSFRELDAANQIKAELALLGISADIQRVMLNGQEVLHRVRLGPYKSVEEMSRVRQRLEDNRIEFVLLELRENTG